MLTFTATQTSHVLTPPFPCLYTPQYEHHISVVVMP
jgi:hypothetical protein